MRLKSKREQLADEIAVLPPTEQLRVLMFPLRALDALHARRAEVDALLAPHIEREHERQREQRRKRTRQRKREAKRLKRAARSAALVLVLALGTACAGVTAADLEPHVATARDLARRNNAAIAVHCVGMPETERLALIRDNIDHAVKLAALQESADDGPGWISQVIAWALSFSRLAGIVAVDPQPDGPDERAMDGTNGNATEPEAPPDHDGDGAADGLELPTRCCPGCGASIELEEAPAIVAGVAWHLPCARSDYARQFVTIDPTEPFGPPLDRHGP